jgi:hypothetical protein
LQQHFPVPTIRRIQAPSQDSGEPIITIPKETFDTAKDIKKVITGVEGTIVQVIENSPTLGAMGGMSTTPGMLLKGPLGKFHDVSYIVIYGVLDQFLQEPNIDVNEFENMILQIVTALCKASDVCKITMRCQPKSKVSSLFPMNIASSFKYSCTSAHFLWIHKNHNVTM